MPALTFAKVAVVFVAVVWAMKRRVPMGLALSAGGLAIALLMGKPPAWIARELATGPEATLFSAHTCQFVAVMGMIVALSYVLDRSRQIERLTTAFRACFRSPRVTMSALPAIIGLLPMPGGALFSAPMVEAGATGTGLDREDKALINYWYRHVWEYAWPLYPGVLLGAQLMHLEVRTLSLAQLPLCAAAISGGFLFLRRAARPSAAREESPRGRAAIDVAAVLLPFALIFALHLAARLDIVIAVAAGLAFTSVAQLASRAIGTAALAKTLFANWGVLDMMLMGYGAKVFGDLLMRSGAIAGISDLFQSMHLPVLALAVAFPFVVGFFSGMTIVFVMTTFPVLLAYPGVNGHPLPVMVLAFAAGYCGTLMSPVHSCLVMSTKYFEADLVKPIRRMIVPCLLILATGVASMLVLRYLHATSAP